MPGSSKILDERFAWGSRDTQTTIHAVDFDTDDPTRIIHDYDHRSLCGHWNEFDDDVEPEADVACTNCLRAGLSREILDPMWAANTLNEAEYITEDQCGEVTEDGGKCDLPASRDDGRCHHHTECEETRDGVPVST